MEAMSWPFTDIVPLEARDAKESLKEGFLVSGPGLKQDRCHLFHGLTFEDELKMCR